MYTLIKISCQNRVAESSRNLEICRQVSKTYYGNSLFCPLSNVSMSVLTVTVIVIVTTYKSSSLTERKGRRQCGCEGRRKESFKGSKTGIGFLHVGLLFRHGGTNAVLFNETMNYILCGPTSALQVGKSWHAGQSIMRTIVKKPFVINLDSFSYLYEISNIGNQKTFHYDLNNFSLICY